MDNKIFLYFIKESKGVDNSINVTFILLWNVVFIDSIDKMLHNNRIIYTY